MLNISTSAVLCFQSKETGYASTFLNITHVKCITYMHVIEICMRLIARNEVCALTLASHAQCARYAVSLGSPTYLPACLPECLSFRLCVCPPAPLSVRLRVGPSAK